jgi:hypothetical protein
MRTRGRGGYARDIAIIDTLGLTNQEEVKELQESEMLDKIKAILRGRGWGVIGDMSWRKVSWPSLKRKYARPGMGQQRTQGHGRKKGGSKRRV